MTDAMVMAEARRIARSRIRDHLRKSGVRISLVEQVELHKAASPLMQYCGEELISEARARLTAPYPFLLRVTFAKPTNSQGNRSNVRCCQHW